MAFIHNSVLLERKKVTGSAVSRRLFSFVHKRVSVFFAAPVRPLRLLAPGTERYSGRFILYAGAYLTNVLCFYVVCFHTKGVVK